MADRAQKDVYELMKANFTVELIDEKLHKLRVLFHGPEDTPYRGGLWKMWVDLAEDYPVHPPTIRFSTVIYHPNVDEISGCVDVFTEKWDPVFKLVHVFEFFLPELLREPNPAHPMNLAAAAKMLHDPTAYEEEVKAYVEAYAGAAPNLVGRMFDILTRDLIMEIFSKFPVADLVNLREVCKQWCEVISCADFADFCLKREILNETKFLIVSYCADEPETEKQQFLLYSEAEEIVPHLNLDQAPPIYNVYYHEVVGYSRGLVCLCEYDPGEFGYLITIWNPLTRKHIFLPDLNLGFDSFGTSFKKIMLSFGFESNTNDHQVICINCIPGLCTIYVYSLKNGAWTNQYEENIPSLRCDGLGAFVEGRSHWFFGGDESNSLQLLVYQLQDGVVSNMEVPALFNCPWNPHKLSLGELQEKLAIMENNLNNFGMVSIWVMNRYGLSASWANIYRLYFEDALYARVVGSTVNEKLVFYLGDWLMALDVKGWPENQTSVIRLKAGESRLKSLGLSGKWKSFWVHSFEKTLFLMDKKHGGSGEQATQCLRLI